MPEQITVYCYDELPPDIKEKVRDEYRTNGFGYDWWDFVHEDFVAILETLGFYNVKTYFSGFWSQGDGACFEAQYRYSAGWKNKLKEYLGEKDLEYFTNQVGQPLQDLQRRHGYQLIVKTVHRGYYCHENTMYHEFYPDGYLHCNYDAEQEQSFREACRDAARWYYRELEEKYNYLSSDKAIDEELEDMDRLYLEDGRRV